ncbi:MAG: ATP synthase F1 subunit gamma [Candidatus Cryptobacteroides sp.]
MATLRETKERIASVRNTLKITSAMKLVASAKLRKAQRSIESLRPYQQALGEILSELCSPAAGAATPVEDGISAPVPEPAGTATALRPEAEAKPRGRVALVCISSNTSLCGAFNANVIRKTMAILNRLDTKPDIYAFGRKVGDALRRAGYPIERDCSAMVQNCNYDRVEEFALHLLDLHRSGVLDKVYLIYTGFVSTSRQKIRVEQFLPYGKEEVVESKLFIVEPSAESLVSELRPQVLALRLYAALLDSAAAEQAARTMAMQTASDNAENLLSELSLEYNKCRQQRITDEILDLAGGSAGE